MMDYAQRAKLELKRFHERRMKKVVPAVFSVMLAFLYLFVIVSTLYAEINVFYWLFAVIWVMAFMAFLDVLDDNDEWFPLKFHRLTLVLNVIAAGVSLALAFL